MADFNPIASFKDGMRKGPPWDSIVEFATHPSFCGMMLYPRQLTLLKVIYLEEEHFTEYDKEVIGGWTSGFTDRLNPMGVQPDLMERIHYLKDHGYSHFPHVQMVLGRRASKGILGGILTAERVAYLYSLGDWQAHFSQVRGQIAEVQVVAPSLNLAVTRQFKDIRNIITGCGYLREHIVNDKITGFDIRTPGDEQTIINNQLAGIQSDREIATIALKASTSASTSGRGGTGIVNCYDEYAHMITGTGSAKTGEEIYDAFQPSLDQFKGTALTYIASSPYCLQPSTRVLTDDLRWVPVGELEVGDKLVGFDEFGQGEQVNGKTRGRTWQPAEVTETSVTQAPRYEITMESGKKIVGTGDHMWLTSWASQVSRWGWVKTKDLNPGDRIKTIGVDPWETDESRDGGWLAGIFDGEGHLSGSAGGQGVLGFAQNPGLVLDKTKEAAEARGFQFREFLSQDRISKLYLTGGSPEIMRFLGSVRPHRLLSKFNDFFYGRRIHSRSGPAVDRVVSVVAKDIGEVVVLGTSTSTLVAEGLLSHNSKIGKFYELYQQGRVTMEEYNAKKGKLEIESFADKAAVQDIDNDDDPTLKATAEPTFLVVQLPSWELYTDWERSREIPMLPGKKRSFPRWPGPIQFRPDADGTADEKVQYRRKLRNPDKFKVERGGQFATVQDAYLDENMVDRMFVPPGWRDPLQLQDRGRLSLTYRAHADPSRTNANFGFCIAHLEDAPPDEYGYVWPHVIIDVLKVWKPEDYENHVVDYVEIGEDIDSYLSRFPTIKKMTYDQYNSAGFIAHQKRKFPNIRVLEQTFTAQENQDRFEKFKSALNLGWIHSYRDEFADEGQSLLELELKFLQEKVTGSRVVVDKQDIGPVKTKDLADAVMVVCTGLLHESLDRWWKSLNRTAVGSTNMAGLRSGREQERLLMHESGRDLANSGVTYADPMTRYFATQAEAAERRAERQERNKATLQNNKLDRARRNAFGGGRGDYEGGRNRGGRG